MTMTPTDFQARLRAATADEPAGGSVEADIAAGRRLLRRRRWLAAAGATAVVLAGAGTVQALGPGPVGSARDSTHVPAATQGTRPAPENTADLLRSCQDGNQSDRATQAVFGSGTPTVKAVSRTSHEVAVAIESADSRYWADCFVHLDDQEFASGMTVYDAAGTSRDSSYSFGPGCGFVDGRFDRSCTSFSVGWVDRRPDAVAAVEFVTSDGVATTVQSQDGYIVFEYLADLPDGATAGVDGLPEDFRPLRRITFLDTAGQPIAAEALDGSGTGPDRERVGDLPSIRAYPALRAPQAIY